ncbi:MAG: hypothetical protein K2I23_07670, partial [Clostridia bacterium]|nr:hypothetical protein [Clostridia bacterium]
YELFIERFYPTASVAQKDDIKRFINNLNKLVGAAPLENAIRDKQLLCSSFYLQRAANGISQPHYEKIRSYLINIFKFANISEIKLIPSRAEVIAAQEICSYFLSLKDLLKFIDKIGTITLNTCNAATDLARIKSVCILGWIGLSLKEIADLKKSDLKLIHDTRSTEYKGYEIRVADKTYYAYDEAFSPLYYLQSIDYYYGLPSGKKIVFKGDENYLFRSTTDNDCHDGNAIKKIIQRFDYLIPVTEKQSIVFRTLNKNRIFLELYNNETDNNYDNSSLLQRIIEKLGCNRITAYTFLGQYQSFATILKSNKL